MVAYEVQLPRDLPAGPRGPGDTLSVVEAAYDLRAPDREWLANLVRSFQPLLEAGHGVFGYFYETSADHALLRVTSPVFLNCPPGLFEGLNGATAEATPAEMARLTGGRPCQSLSQVLQIDARSGQQRSVSAGAPLAQIGVVDLLMVSARFSDRTACSVIAPLGRAVTPSARTANMMSRVARHIAVAQRLRSSLSRSEQQTGSVEVDAIFGERGALLHAEGRAKQKDQRLALSEAVRRLVEGRNRLAKCDPDQVVRLWNALVEGRWSLVHSVDSDGKRFLIARKNTPELRAPTALSPDERHLAALFAFGHSTKLVAYELGLSPSTVSTRFANVLRKLKVESRAQFVRLFGAQRTWR